MTNEELNKSVKQASTWVVSKSTSIQLDTIIKLLYEIVNRLPEKQQEEKQQEPSTDSGNRYWDFHGRKWVSAPPSVKEEDSL